MPAAERLVGLPDAFQRVGVGQEVLRLALEHVSEGDFLVPRLAEEADDGLRLGEGAVALADLEPFLALLDGGGAVRRVHDGHGAFRPCGPVLAQHREREAVERAAVDAAEAVAEQVRGPEQHFAAGLARKGEQEHGLGRHALFRQPRQTVDDGAGLAAPRARNDQHRTVRGRHRLKLRRVQCRNVYHGNSVGRTPPAARRVAAPLLPGGHDAHRAPRSRQAAPQAETAFRPAARLGGGWRRKRPSPSWFQENVFPIQTQTLPKHKSFGSRQSVDSPAFSSSKPEGRRP